MKGAALYIYIFVCVCARASMLPRVQLKVIARGRIRIQKRMKYLKAVIIGFATTMDVCGN